MTARINVNSRQKIGHFQTFPGGSWFDSPQSSYLMAKRYRENDLADQMPLISRITHFRNWVGLQLP